jgi:hypothetical protein
MLVMNSDIGGEMVKLYLLHNVIEGSPANRNEDKDHKRRIGAQIIRESGLPYSQ